MKPNCVICNEPFWTWRKLAVHIATHHRSLISFKLMPTYSLFTCACGYSGRRGNMGRHLSEQRDLSVHFEHYLLDDDAEAIAALIKAREARQAEQSVCMAMIRRSQ